MGKRQARREVTLSRWAPDALRDGVTTGSFGEAANRHRSRPGAPAGRLRSNGPSDGKPTGPIFSEF